MRALDSSPGNLRAAASSFIGRESELDEVQAAVNAHRLVTLTGVGGVGKTRLATEVAARLTGEFPDGVWVFELAAMADPAAVPDAVAAVLGITQQPGKSVADSVAAALEGRVRLLVFDNCEHVLDDDADLIEAILAQSATVRIVATREVRDHLDHRFRLLVGSRRGLARHHTLRHAVAWSYDHLDDAEKTLLDRCSVFAGGFDLQSACAIAGSDEVDDYAILDLLDALVRKSLLVADRSGARTRFSMLETIRQFAEEQLVASGEATEVRTAHSRYFAAGRETDIMALWDSPRQREAYDWFTAELANLRTAFRWAADQGDLDIAATIATYAGWLGYLVENYELIAWAEELIGPARAVDHPRLAALYVMASQCWMPGRIEEAVGYSDAAQMDLGSGGGEAPFGIEGMLGGAYIAIGQPERWVEWCRAQLAHGRDSHAFTRASLVVALKIAGFEDEAMAATKGLIDAAEATRNPLLLSLALLAYGLACRNADPARALDTLRRGLVIAQDSGSRFTESNLAIILSQLEAKHGDPLAPLEHLALAIRNCHDSGNTLNMRTALAVLAACLDRLGRYEPAATIARFAFNPLTAAWLPEISTAIAHLRDVFGDQTYESLARKGETMTTAAMATYAYDQIDQARAELNAASK